MLLSEDPWTAHELLLRESQLRSVVDEGKAIS
jgi:hypothetical protein